jgi:hypothetical protein
VLAECCVFGKQLQPPITCDLHSLQEQVLTRSKAYLLPKLRYQFAEFLNPSSLKRLSRLSAHPPVSVYGTVCYCLKLRGFSWERGIEHFGARSASSSRLGIEPPDLPGGPSYLLKPGTSPGCCSLLRHPIAAVPGTGILTCFPSTTPFGLALGTDSPCAD